ncbi:MAG: WecB/TagA/CpsF family glycosyltransferase [Oscillospiraceae bacterium]|nr:WecB/TagA/CpsF family glycosyltransferase [Oscillospiraceae bacterium]
MSATDTAARTDVMGVGFDNVDMDEAVERAWELMVSRKGAYVVTPNPEIIMCCRTDAEAEKAVNGADLIIADGIGVIYGAKILKTPLKQKLPGIDFTCRLLERMAAQGMSLFLFGSKPGVAEKAAETLAERYAGLRIAGTNDGYFTNDANIVKKINEAAPDLLMVCLGAPKQEKWMAQRRGEVNAGLMIGAGGSLDVFAGTAERAPEKWQKAGLEWLYRLYKEPRRAGRMMKLPQFLLLTIGKRIRGK